MSCDIVPHIMDHGMVFDTLPNPTQSSITTFQIFLNAGSDPIQGRPATQRRQGPAFLSS